MAVNKPVYFNEENEQDRMMLKFLENKKFATYVKNLIMNDISGTSNFNYKGRVCRESRRMCIRS